MNNIETLRELCEVVSRELSDCNKEIRMSGGKLQVKDIDYLDKLAHTLKSLKSSIEMMDSDEGYSNRYMPYYYGESGGGSGGRSYRGGNSYARGGRGGGRGGRRGGYSREGGYSRDGGYSYAAEMDDVISDMRELLGEMPDAKRATVERLINELES